MKIIISPTKQMTTEEDFFLPESTPLFLEATQEILATLQQLSFEELKKIWKCSDKLAIENFERLKQTNLIKHTAPAIMSYKGIQYQYMAPSLLTKPELAYLQKHLRILSGFYGVLKPFDGIVPYRLEMQAPLKLGNETNLYHYWGKRLYEALDFSTGPVINLASKEYSKTLTHYLTNKDQLIDIHFYHSIDGKLKVKATLAKMARGEMVRYLAEHNVTTIKGIQEFDHPHYHFSTEHSNDQSLVFIFED